jgi:hypothetical protein
VITSVRYAAQLDASGNPAKDANGRFIKTDKILRYTVKEKWAGWGAEYSEAARNGKWKYRLFRADKTANPDTKYDGCSAVTSRRRARIICLLTTASKPRHAERSGLRRLPRARPSHLVISRAGRLRRARSPPIWGSRWRS